MSIIERITGNARKNIIIIIISQSSGDPGRNEKEESLEMLSEDRE